MNEKATAVIDKAIKENTTIQVSENLYLNSATGQLVIKGDSKFCSIKTVDDNVRVTNLVLCKTLTEVVRTAKRTKRDDVKAGDIFVSKGDNQKPYLRFVTKVTEDAIECTRPGGGMVVYKDIPINDLMGDEDIFIIREQGIAPGTLAHKRLQEMLEEEKAIPQAQATHYE